MYAQEIGAAYGAFIFATSLLLGSYRRQINMPYPSKAGEGGSMKNFGAWPIKRGEALNNRPREMKYVSRGGMASWAPSDDDIMGANTYARGIRSRKYRTGISSSARRENSTAPAGCR